MFQTITLRIIALPSVFRFVVGGAKESNQTYEPDQEGAYVAAPFLQDVGA